MNSGIYKIINTSNGNYYVGSATNLTKRWKRHIQSLNKKTHFNDHLQNAWDKYGEKSFTFSIIEYVDKKKLEKVEQKYLNIAKSEQNISYNLTFDSTCPNRNCSAYTREKLSKSLKLKYATDSKFRKHVTTAALGNSAWNKGISLSNKQKMKIKTTLKKYYSNPEILKKCRLQWKSNKHRKKVSESKIHKEKYSFCNTKTGEIFIGTKSEFGKKSGDCHNFSSLLKRKRKTIKGWKLME